MNLTKRQLICFAGAGLLGVPTYLFTSPHIGTQAAALLLVIVAFPMFAFALFEKDGIPLEKYLKNMITVKFMNPAIRVYRPENKFAELERYIELEREVQAIVEENNKSVRGKKAKRSSRQGA